MTTMDSRHSRRELLLLWAAGRLTGAALDTVGLSFGTYGMKAMPTGEAIRQLRAIGYDGIELCLRPGWPADPEKLSPAEKNDIRGVLESTGLSLAAVQDELLLLGTAASRAYNRERLQLAADLAHHLSPNGPAVLDTVLGLKTSDWDTGKDRMRDEIGEWARLARSLSLQVGIKPHVGHAMDTPEKALWMMRQIHDRHVGLVFDYGHMFLGGFSLESSLRQLIGHTVLICVKDASGTAEKFRFLLPGDGATDYGTYFRLLRELRYSGFVNVEVSAMIHAVRGYDAIETARLCYGRLAPKFVEAGWPRAGLR
jgi:sugar phosphate isomerase/epimerase